jgi:predicted permease
MRSLSAWWSKRREAREQELDRELQSHLEVEAEEQRDAGAPEGESRYRALRAMGNTTLVKEDVHAAWGGRWLEQAWQDLRYGFRGLRRNPGFTMVAALSLALGIGGNTAVFTLVNAFLLQRLPYSEPDQLVEVTGSYPKGAIVALQQVSRSMDIAAYTPDSEFNLKAQGEAQRMPGSAVSANLFSVLGVGAELGRALRTGDDQPGQDGVVVLSDALWRKNFGADSQIVGRMVTVDGVARQVIGVMPANFAFPSGGVQLWTPLHMNPSNAFDFWNTGFIPLVARLRPGATLAQARGEVRPLVEHAIAAFPYTMPHSWNADANVVPLQEFLVSGVRSKLIVLQCAVGLVLLIACANVASLLLARAAVRQKEMALRSALGAARGRIVRQLLTESVVLGLVGAAAGLALAYGALAILKSALPMNTPGWQEVRINPQVLGFATLLAIVSGLAFGLIPAISSSRTNLATTMRASGRRSASTAGVRFRGGLIATEVALAVVLAVGAGLLVKSLWMLAQVNPGFSPQHILTLRVSPDQSFCRERSRCIALYAQLLQRTHEISGVTDVAATNVLPLSGEVPSIPAETEGHPDVPDTLGPMLWAGAVTPEYFRVMGIPVLEGRSLRESEGENTELVAVVSAATAKRFWPSESPIGKHLRPVWGQQPWRAIVGVVGDVHQYHMDAGLPDGIGGVVYMPYPQAVGNDRQLPSSMTLVVRTAVDPQRVASEIRGLVAQLNPNTPVSEVQSMEAVVTSSNSQTRSLMWIFVCFAGAAVLLAAIGTYGVISFSTSQRLYEMGVRIALGATRGNLFGLILKLSLRLVLTGLAFGIVLAFVLTRMLASFLYGVSTTDPLTFLAVAVLLVVVAIIAGFVPARKAAGVDPAAALRAE